MASTYCKPSSRFEISKKCQGEGKASTGYTVKPVVFASGERFAELVNCRTGLPLFDVTVYTLVEVRGRNRASATIEQVLRAIKVFVLFCDLYGIVVKERIREGRLLEMGEIDALVRLCRFHLPDIESRLTDESVASDNNQQPVISLQAYRARAKPSRKEVLGESTAIRIRYIRQYLRWLADLHLLSLSLQHPTHAPFSNVKNIVLAALDARVPTAKGRNSANARTGLSEEAQKRLWQVIDSKSPNNPWTGTHTRLRNELIVRWFLGLGLRRGELLGVEVSDVDLKKNEVFIARRADDKADPRARQPNTKTADRLLPLSEDLAKRTRDYIIKVRYKLANARKHPFLFVANGGRPLSLEALNKIFIVLRQRCPDLPDELFPHLLRHTWNDNFSKKMDEGGISPEHEQKMRSRLMGWNPTSNAAEKYLRRTIQRKARKASLEMQEKMVLPNDENKQ